VTGVMSKENQELNIKHTKLNERFREVIHEVKDLEDRTHVQKNENAALRRHATTVEIKYKEIQSGYKDLMNNLESTMRRAVKFEQDKESLLQELRRISKQMKKSKAFQILEEDGGDLVEDDLDGDEDLVDSESSAGRHQQRNQKRKKKIKATTIVGQDQSLHNDVN